MEYRPFGRLGFKVSALGFGCMRLPVRGGRNDVDEAAAVEMIRFAIDQGVNYVDTAQPYHGGASERVVGLALEGGYRSRAAVATKMPVWLVEKPADFDRLFDEQCERLRMSRVEFYLLHDLRATRWKKMLDLGAIPWLERQRAAGRIGEIGFSFHDKYEVLREILDGYGGWTFCQIQYNFIGEDVQAGTKGLKLAAERGLGVVVMEPLLGGALANPPPPIRKLWDESPGRPDPADIALRWLWNRPEVSVVLSGMSTLDQVKRNLASACAAGVGRMGTAELDVVARVRDAYQALHPIPCTQCGYCVPCPHGVAIPDTLELYNIGLTFGGNALSLYRALYGNMPAEQNASACEACGECEPKCPQQIPITQWMPRVHEELSKKP
jgi:predicted aldo/keto reductase-like oxidoreductase